jgi:hypothetical protein
MYRLIVARRTSTGTCGHLIIPGDVIGFSPETHRTLCRECFKRRRLEEHTKALERMKVG